MRGMGPHHVLLVPGFFGFANLGDFAYFAHVHDFLRELAPTAGIDGEVRVVDTIPTASLRKRAARLAERMAEVLDARGGTLTLVGHSSGGLDARLVVAPGVSLPTAVDVERCARAVRAVVTVSAPHHGTPVAHAFNSLLGQQLLRTLSLLTIYALRAGRLPIGVVLRLAGWVARPNAPPSGVVDQIWKQLLADFSLERRIAIDAFFGSVGFDQDLLPQITPAAMDVFNASTENRPGVRYGCVVTRARPPGIRSFLSAGFSAYAQATHALYVALYRLASKTPRARAPRPTRAQAARLRAPYGLWTGPGANDGMVPSLSQLWGEVVHATWADHLDVIGHFHHPTHVPPHFDWLTSGSGFDHHAFEAVWRDVAHWIGAGLATRSLDAAAAPGERRW
jgi:triacylglycerol lipase